MDTQQHHPRIPEVKFRALIIRMENTGETSTLQRVSETTESPVVYRVYSKEIEEVRVSDPTLSSSRATLISIPIRLCLTRRWMLVAIVLLFYSRE